MKIPAEPLRDSIGAAMEDSPTLLFYGQNWSD